MKSRQICTGLLPVFALSLMTCAINSALAAETSDLGVVSAQAGSIGSNGELSHSASKAATTAPTRASLDATQPQSIISRQHIENAASPVADFSAIAAIAPSVSLGISTNGPGLGETKNSIRGFKDGEFNITFDGIPFGDTNGPTHHSTAYFPASVIGEVVVERGPGTASNIGQATFGGSINIFSRPVANDQNFSVYTSAGTWNTRLYGVRYDSGILNNWGDGKVAVSYQKQESDGYLTYSPIQGENFMLKVEKPVGNSTLITANLNYNRNWYYQSDVIKGLTAIEASTLGKNYMLGNDPTKANYYGYNRTEKSTWMNYVRIQSDLGNGWNIDNNTYYYNYTNNTLSSSASSVLTGLGTVKTITGASLTNQMPGYRKVNEYAVTGNLLKTTKQTDSGLARFGLWLERASTHRSLYDYNLLTGGPNYDQNAVAGTELTGINNVTYDQKSGWNQYQPFAEYEWAVNNRLTVTPGIKRMSTTMHIDALVNQTGRTNQTFDKDFSSTLPFLTANYKLDSSWATYAQFAKGMLVPNIGSFQSSNATATKIDPQRSTNYQWGIIHKSDRLVFDADLYYIDFTNKIAQLPGTTSANAIYYNQGGVVYKGLETQLNYAWNNGISAYANFSLNRAETKDSAVSATLNGKAIAGVPNRTAALGVVYNQGPWNGSLIQKMVGKTYALDGAAYPIDPYSSLDFNVGYTFKNPGLGAKNLKLSFAVFNVLNRQDVLSVSAKNSTADTAAYGTPNAGDALTFQPGRSVMLSMKADF